MKMKGRTAKSLGDPVYDRRQGSKFNDKSLKTLEVDAK
jgi:hypothetical protein